MSAARIDIGWRAVGAGGLVLLVWLSLTPDALALAHVAHLDKLQHFAAYAVLATWLVQLDKNATERRTTGVALLALGLALELAQLGIARREFSIGDVAANAAGVALAQWLAPPRTPNLLALAVGCLAARPLAPAPTTDRP